MLTHAEKIAAVAALLLLLAVVVAWLFDRYVLVVSWWPLVGRNWRAELADRKDAERERRNLDVQLIGHRFDEWPDEDDEPSTDDDADAMIAAWHGDDPMGFRDEQQEQLAAVHPIYLDLSDDPDLIVWDAKQQADRCWEIVHVEFPRLRAELAGMWEAA